MAAISDFNLQKLSMKEFEENIRATVEFGGNFLSVARRGTGKSMVSRKAIQDAGCKEVFANLSVYDRVDLAGFPKLFNADPNVEYVKYLLTTLFEPLIEGDKKCVLLLDEVDKADTSLWAPLLEITEDRRINGRPLKNLQAIIMTANLTSEGGNRPCLPLLDRCEKYLIETNVAQWLDWASREGSIHPSITAYINDHPEDLFGDVDPGDLYADPSPRGWHKASNVITFGEAKRWPTRILTNKVAGFVGKKAGIKYSSYFEHYQVILPLVEKVMKGEKISGFKDMEPSKQLVSIMVVCARLTRILDEVKPKVDNHPKESVFVAKFLQNVDSEMALIGIRSQIGLKRASATGLDELPEFDRILRDIVKRINKP
jgi:hypothetical protein